MRRARVHFEGAVMACWCGLATANAGESDPVAAQLHAPSLTFSLVRVMGALALVFCVFLGGIWVFRNWHRLTIQKGRLPKLNVLEVKSLGPRHALYVIGYEQQRFLLSSAPTGVTMLTELPCAEVNATDLPPPQSPLKFSEFLLKAVARK